jgi:hypothetical protein
MIRRTLFLSLGLALLLSGCATSRAGKSARKPAPTPSEKLAMRHYKMGIDAYANTQYSEAIKHWKVTLDKDPENPNAKEYIARAENMLKVLKTAETK